MSSSKVRVLVGRFLGIYYFVLGLVLLPTQAQPLAPSANQKLVKDLQKSAQQGNPQAQFTLGQSYLRNPSNPAEATRWLQAAADQGYRPAQTLLGSVLLSQDVTAAGRWLRLAATLGDPQAQTSLGWMYKLGIGLSKDPSEALRWGRMGKDNPSAQHLVGGLLVRGEGTTQDVRAGLELLRAAATQGFAPAQYSLAMLHFAEIPNAVLPDGQEAFKWMQKAADQGYTDAQAQLALMYEKGTGTTADPQQALRWQKLAADQGSVLAQAGLAERYQTGKGVPQDNLQAFQWYFIATELSAVNDRSAYQAEQYKVQRQMQLLDIVQARTQAKAWRSTYDSQRTQRLESKPWREEVMLISLPPTDVTVTAFGRLSASCLEQKMDGSISFQSTMPVNSQGEYLIGLGLGNAQERSWWKDQNCRPNEDTTKFAQTGPKTYYVSGFCKSDQLTVKTNLYSDQAVLACMKR